MQNIIETIGVVVFDKKLSKVLLVEHLEEAEHENNVFGIPAGRLNIDQPLLDNALRELEEETGLTAKPKHMIRLPHHYKAHIRRKSGEIKHFRLQTYLCTKYKGKLKGSNETRPVWVLINELNYLKLLPNMKEVIADALTYAREN